MPTILLAVAVALAAAPPPSASFEADLDGDGVAERVDVYVSTDNGRGFARIVAEGARPWTTPAFPAWKIRAGDVDRDGREELILGLWSHKKRHDEPSPHRTIMVYEWLPGPPSPRLAPQWRGSALAQPLIDAEPADLDGAPGAELLALEHLVGAPERCRLVAYRYNGFGFRGLASRSISCRATLRGGDRVALEGEGRARAHLDDEGRLALEDLR